jgi:acetyl-CoA acetyltransferase
MSGVGIAAAANAVADGRAEVVALAYGNDGRSRRVYYGGAGSGEDRDLWQAWGMTSPGAEHALLFRRHSHLYGTTSRQLAEVSVAFRGHAALNPAAVMREPITVEDHQRSRFIVEPLHLLDYCLINDGGVALVVTTLERARDCRRSPVEVLAAATAGGLAEASFPPEDFWRAPMEACADDSFGRAGLAHADVDVAQIYDNFSPTVLFTLEGFGYCGTGEGGAFVEDGALRLGGRLPTNTSGGHLSESYMQGWALNVEAVRQVRGEGGERQVPGARVAHYMCAAPLCSSILYGAPA